MLCMTHLTIPGNLCMVTLFLSYFLLLQELQSLKLFPLEVVPGTVYMGTASQAQDSELMKRLAVKCLVNASPEVPVRYNHITPHVATLSLTNIRQTA